MITQLLHEHTRLRAMTAELVSLVARDAPGGFQALAQKRWEIARTVHQHLVREEREVFQRLLRDPRPEARIAAERCKYDIEALHQAYTEHTNRWTLEAIQADWSGFRAAIKGFAVRMRMRLDREEKHLYPFLDGILRTPIARQVIDRNWAGAGLAMRASIENCIPSQDAVEIVCGETASVFSPVRSFEPAIRQPAPSHRPAQRR